LHQYSFDPELYQKRLSTTIFTAYAVKGAVDNFFSSTKMPPPRMDGMVWFCALFSSTKMSSLRDLALHLDLGPNGSIGLFYNSAQAG
jgi:hypothetical protein